MDACTFVHRLSPFVGSLAAFGHVCWLSRQHGLRFLPSPQSLLGAAPQADRASRSARASAATGSAAPGAATPTRTTATGPGVLIVSRLRQAMPAAKPTTRKGSFPKPRPNFDRAVDLMLSSGIDIKTHSAAAGRVRPHRRRVNALGDGGPEAGQRLRAQDGAHARRCRRATSPSRWTPTSWPRPRPIWRRPSPTFRSWSTTTWPRYINFFANTQRATTRCCTPSSAPAATRR